MSMTPVYLLLASFGIAVLRHWAKAHKDSQRTYGPKPVLAPQPLPPWTSKSRTGIPSGYGCVGLFASKDSAPKAPSAPRASEGVTVTGERCRMTQQGSPGAPLRAPGPRIHGGAKHVGLGRALKDSFGPGWCHVKGGRASRERQALNLMAKGKKPR